MLWPIPNDWEGKIFGPGWISQLFESADLLCHRSTRFTLVAGHPGSSYSVQISFTPPYCLEIFTDSSELGWGTCCGTFSAQGLRSPQEHLQHINFLELKAVLLALQCWATDLTNCRILLRIDNTTAIAYINRMSGGRFVELSNLAKPI